MRKILLIVSLLTSVACISATITSQNSGNWNTGSTWDTGNVPTNADNVIIAAGHTINVLNSNGVAETITVNSSGKLRIYQTLTVDNTAVNNGTMNVNTGGSFVLSAGNFTNSGSLTIAKGRSMTMANSTTLTNSGSISLTSDSNEYARLQLNGTYTASGSGSVTYGRFVTGVSANWDLIGPPTTNTDAADFISNNGDLAQSGSDYGIGPYNNNTNTWTTWSNGDAISNGTLTSGKGFQMAASGASGAAMEFTGGINAGGVNVVVINNDSENSGSGTRFNLVSNPYPSFINVNSNAGTNNIIGVNGSSGNSVLMSGAFNCIYAWGGASYTTINQASGASYMAPGQGFMIAAESTSNANFQFAANMQTSSGSDDFISGDAMDPDRAELFINLNQNDLERHTEIYFIDEGSNGLDIGYDSATFSLANNLIYSRLVSDDEGIDMSIQSLPFSEINDKVISLGFNAEAGAEATISISHNTTNPSTYVYLEDAVEGTFTNLKETDFVITPDSDLQGVGRFFIHTSATTMSNEESVTSLLNVFKLSNNNFITIEGLATQSNQTNLKLYNLLGKEVLSTILLNNTNTQTISTEGLSAGIYVIKLESGNDLLTKKLIIK
jgi:hypothetical protein